MRKLQATFAVLSFIALASVASADQGGFSNSGGSTGVGANVTITSAVGAPPGSLTISCPITGPTVCSGGSFTYQATDGSLSIIASFTSGKIVESCSGGGRGGHVTCAYSFIGYFSGTATANALVQSINGVTYQGFGTNGKPATGTSAYNSAYTPFYYTDSEAIHRSDDLHGTNQVSFGSQGSGVGQFYGSYGTALDSAGRIYIADAYNCRIVRIDDMTGKNWVTYGGTCGSGKGQFSDPFAVAVDHTGKIYIMDTNNSRIVRIDDMTGANWVSFGSPGSGKDQFASFTSIAVDSLGRIYVADTGNVRVVRMDDINGTNWTVLTSSPVVNGVSYRFSSPVGVGFDSTGRIYIADNEFQTAIVRVDDMTGKNWTGVYVGSNGLNSISVDAHGTVFAAGGGIRLIDNMAGVLNSSGSIGPIGPAYIFGVTAVPLPSPRPPAITVTPTTLTFANQNIGSSSASQPVTITNFGGSPLHFWGSTSTGGFTHTTNCPGSLIAGSSCTVYISFSPKVGGAANGQLTLSDNSRNLGAKQVISLSGFATVPVAQVAPTSMVFPSQLLNSTSAAQSVSVLNTGNGPLQVTSVTATGPFAETDNCSASIAPGSACTILVTLTPTVAGAATGTLSIADNTGKQTVRLTGTGGSVAPTVTVSPAAVLFPPQLLQTKSAGQTVTITNNGKASISNSGPKASGDFSTSNGCPASLGAGQSCTITLFFTPTAVGTRTGAVTIGLSTGPQNVSLTGTGSNGTLPSALSLTPSPLTFSGYIVGDNPSQNVTVTNTSGASVGVSNIVLIGDPSLTQQNTCPAVLTAGASCTITVTFVPVVNGTFTGTLTLTEASGTKDNVSITAIAAPDG